MGGLTEDLGNEVARYLSLAARLMEGTANVIRHSRRIGVSLGERLDEIRAAAEAVLAEVQAFPREPEAAGGSARPGGDLEGSASEEPVRMDSFGPGPGDEPSSSPPHGPAARRGRRRNVAGITGGTDPGGG